MAASSQQSPADVNITENKVLTLQQHIFIIKYMWHFVFNIER